MAESDKGMLLVWVDIAAPAQDDFNEWYDREHLADRVSVPGFLDGRRFQALSGGPEFFAVYETRDPATLRSAAYRERLQHPTPWTSRVMPHFRNTVRGVCRQTVRAGHGAGGVLATLRLSPDPARRAPLRQWLAQSGLPGIVGLPGVLAACLAEGVAEPAQQAPTAEVALRGSEDRSVDWAILVEGIAREPVERATHTLLAEAGAAQGVPSLSADAGLYRYLCGVARSAQSP
ncbi:MAG: hypothetical protein ACHQZQ_02500 [SAR324 cluster bacterium]